MISIDKCIGLKELKSLLYLGVMSYVVLIKIIQRIGFKKACIALANKIVRIPWAMLRYETAYKTILLNAD